MEAQRETVPHDALRRCIEARPASETLFTSASGMATLTDRGHAILQQLEKIFVDWASLTQAASIRYPALIHVSDLDRLNYFRNFPHLVLCACVVDGSAHESHGHRKEDIALLDHGELQDAEFCLPPAACYNVYLSLRGQRLAATRHVTTVANCFRNEDYYDGLKRLRAFTLREIVCVGTAEDVKAHLMRYRAITLEFFSHLGLPIEMEHASDPFFDKAGTAARAARIFPTKEEVLYRGELAIASLNYHRRFFGERCEISVGDGPAHTGCVGFGLERWIQALAEHFGADVERILAALSSAHAKVMFRWSGSR
jgi:threonyl-tRNA synthetase